MLRSKFKDVSLKNKGVIVRIAMHDDDFRQLYIYI